MARQQDRQKARAMKKKMLDEARAATPVPTMRVPLLGQKPELKDFAQSVDELELLGDLVLIREISQEKTAGGIVLPDGAKQEGPRKGEVMAVGEGAMREDGTYMPMQVKVCFLGSRPISAKWRSTDSQAPRAVMPMALWS